MTVHEHVYPIPTDAELQQMVGAATPHFALQIRSRIGALADGLPADDPRRAKLEATMAQLDRLATGGEPGTAGQAELPTRPSLNLGVGAPAAAHE